MLTGVARPAFPRRLPERGLPITVQLSLPLRMRGNLHRGGAAHPELLQPAADGVAVGKEGLR